MRPGSPAWSGASGGAAAAGSGRWSAREIAAASFFLAHLVVQIALPLRQIAAGDFRRFGWQMFARANQPPTYVRVRADGSRDSVPLGDRVGNWRGDLDWSGEAIPEQLCRLDSEAVEIVVLTRDDGPDRSVKCW